MSQAICYISCSALVPFDKLLKVSTILESYNVKPTFYRKGTNYSIQKLEEADFVMFLCNSAPVLQHRSHFNSYISMVGRGQWDEAMYCCENNKPSYIIEGMSENTLSLLKMSLLEPCEHSPERHQMTAKNWQTEYGWLKSYSDGKGVFSMQTIAPKNYPLQDNQTSLFNRSVP
jgi:hypothetical protein